MSNGIKFISRGAVSHVEFLVDGKSIGAHLEGGVAIRDINGYPLDIRFQATCTDLQYAAAMAFLRAQIGKPYDLLDIAGIMCARDWHDPARWICSELWAATLEMGSIMGSIDSSITLFTPQDALVVSSAMFTKLS
jgi:hypothetical protein